MLLPWTKSRIAVQLDER